MIKQHGSQIIIFTAYNKIEDVTKYVYYFLLEINFNKFWELLEEICSFQNSIFSWPLLVDDLYTNTYPPQRQKSVDNFQKTH